MKRYGDKDMGNRSINEDLKKIGQYCRDWRKRNNYPIEYIAIGSCCSVYNIMKFEEGRNNSAIILLEYLRRMSENIAREVIKLW